MAGCDLADFLQVLLEPWQWLDDGIYLLATYEADFELTVMEVNY